MIDVSRVAIAEDDAESASFLLKIVQAMGHRPTSFTNGEDLVRQLSRDTFDLLLLDWNMPRLSGLDVLRWSRTHIEVPPAVIMISSRAEKLDVTTCLSEGADDYIIKPEAASVVRARIEAVLRRTAPRAQDQRLYTYGTYCFDKLQGTVSYGGATHALTAKEFALAMMFFQNQNRPISRAYILETVWKSVGDLPTRTLDMHVSRIRAKLALGPQNGFRLSTIFGYGYRLETYSEAD